MSDCTLIEVIACGLLGLLILMAAIACLKCMWDYTLNRPPYCILAKADGSRQRMKFPQACSEAKEGDTIELFSGEYNHKARSAARIRYVGWWMRK